MTGAMRFRNRKRDGTVPAPIVVAPSGQFQGSDGSWSTFKLSAGTSAQQFYVTISTLASAVWLPSPDGCAAASQLGVSESECARRRGIQLYNGGTSLGFQSNQSSSYSDDGIQKLSLTPELDSGNMSAVYGSIYDLGATFGQDTVALSAQSGGSSVSATDTYIATIADPYDFTLGSLGLAFGDTQVGNSTHSTFMESIANGSSIPSHSWSYTAGASYESNGVVGSLVLGGYDQLRVKGDNASIAMPTSTEETLLRVSVQSLSMKFNNNSVSSLTANSNGQTSTFNAILDFTLPYLYLPNDIVNSLQNSMRLSYNSASDIYLFNNTQSLDITSFTFDLADPSNSNEKTSVTLPFAAFNLSTSWPLGTANYFPIRKAPDNSTFILGRSFFQEAIVVADYERRNFTIGQAAFPSSSNTQIVTIFNTTFDQSTQNSDNNNNSGGGGLSGGAIAGIVIGVVLGLAFLALAFWLWRRRKRQAGKQNSQVHAAAFESAHEEKLGQQANLNRERSDTILSGETAASYELGAMPLAQRPNHNRHVSELSSDSETTMAAKLRPSAIYEMPDTSYLAENERVSNRRSSSPALTSSAPTRETSMRTATTTAPSPIMTAASPAMSSREPLSGVAEVPSPPNSPGPSRQLSVTPSRGVSRFSERSSDMQP